ncbi:hypothetical protein FA95DRAFT_1613046 [Auriscalpium vulgare]|uniref:Uncharacterized protein n=1 Tax=Auriscalpium vulgare TaxID=40419 RepID=A0ACB8R4Q0_9AGAM|nr:hypothetical protein FA95DRAFT_1613046 [Auriscalpium vulgare]
MPSHLLAANHEEPMPVPPTWAGCVRDHPTPQTAAADGAWDPGGLADDSYGGVPGQPSQPPADYYPARWPARVNSGAPPPSPSPPRAGVPWPLDSDSRQVSRTGDLPCATVLRTEVAHSPRGLLRVEHCKPVAAASLTSTPTPSSFLNGPQQARFDARHAHASADGFSSPQQELGDILCSSSHQQDCVGRGASPYGYARGPVVTQPVVFLPSVHERAIQSRLALEGDMPAATGQIDPGASIAPAPHGTDDFRAFAAAAGEFQTQSRSASGIVRHSYERHHSSSYIAPARLRHGIRHWWPPPTALLAINLPQVSEMPWFLLASDDLPTGGQPPVQSAAVSPILRRRQSRTPGRTEPSCAPDTPAPTPLRTAAEESATPAPPLKASRSTPACPTGRDAPPHLHAVRSGGHSAAPTTMVRYTSEHSPAKWIAVGGAGDLGNRSSASGGSGPDLPSRPLTDLPPLRWPKPGTDCSPTSVALPPPSAPQPSDPNIRQAPYANTFSWAAILRIKVVQSPQKRLRVVRTGPTALVSVEHTRVAGFFVCRLQHARTDVRRAHAGDALLADYGVVNQASPALTQGRRQFNFHLVTRTVDATRAAQSQTTTRSAWEPPSGNHPSPKADSEGSATLPPFPSPGRSSFMRWDTVCSHWRAYSACRNLQDITMRLDVKPRQSALYHEASIAHVIYILMLNVMSTSALRYETLPVLMSVLKAARAVHASRPPMKVIPGVVKLRSTAPTSAASILKCTAARLNESMMAAPKVLSTQDSKPALEQLTTALVPVPWQPSPSHFVVGFVVFSFAGEGGIIAQATHFLRRRTPKHDHVKRRWDYGTVTDPVPHAASDARHAPVSTPQPPLHVCAATSAERNLEETVRKLVLRQSEPGQMNIRPPSVAVRKRAANRHKAFHYARRVTYTLLLVNATSAPPISTVAGLALHVALGKLSSQSPSHPSCPHTRGDGEVASSVVHARTEGPTFRDARTEADSPSKQRRFQGQRLHRGANMGQTLHIRVVEPPADTQQGLLGVLSQRRSALGFDDRTERSSTGFALGLIYVWEPIAIPMHAVSRAQREVFNPHHTEVVDQTPETGRGMNASAKSDNGAVPLAILIKTRNSSVHLLTGFSPCSTLGALNMRRTVAFLSPRARYVARPQLNSKTASDLAFVKEAGWHTHTAMALARAGYAKAQDISYHADMFDLGDDVLRDIHLAVTTLRQVARCAARITTHHARPALPGPHPSNLQVSTEYEAGTVVTPYWNRRRGSQVKYWVQWTSAGMDDDPWRANRAPHSTHRARRSCQRSLTLFSILSLPFITFGIGHARWTSRSHATALRSPHSLYHLSFPPLQSCQGTSSANTIRSFMPLRTAHFAAQARAWHDVGSSRATQVMPNERSNAHGDGLDYHVPQPRGVKAHPSWLAYLWPLMIGDLKHISSHGVHDQRQAEIFSGETQFLIGAYTVALARVKGDVIHLLDNPHRTPANLPLDCDSSGHIRCGHGELHVALTARTMVTRRACFALAFHAGLAAQQESLLFAFGHEVKAEVARTGLALSIGGAPFQRSTVLPEPKPEDYRVPHGAIARALRPPAGKGSAWCERTLPGRDTTGSKQGVGYNSGHRMRAVAALGTLPARAMQCLLTDVSRMEQKLCPCPEGCSVRAVYGLQDVVHTSEDPQGGAAAVGYPWVILNTQRQAVLRQAMRSFPAAASRAAHAHRHQPMHRSGPLSMVQALLPTSPHSPEQ